VDVVQRLVVELLKEFGPHIVEDRKVDDPACPGVDRTAQRELDPVTVAVHARAFMPRRHPWQVMRGFERKDFFEIN
jgi:hypothetical protein